LSIGTVLAARVGRRLAALLSAVLGCALLGCPRSPAERTVLLVSLDTLRADAVEGFGAPAGASPNLVAFLSDAVLFANSYAPEPHTLPAHTTLFTSLHPVSHGVVGRLQGGIGLPAGIPTLAEILKAEGFATAAFVNGGFLHPRFGLARGFDTYDYFSDIDDRGEEIHFGRTAAETNTRVFEWLDGREGRDAFLFVHYFDVHSDSGALPYDSPADYRSRPSSGHDWGSQGGSNFLNSYNATGELLADDRLAALHELYAAGVRYTDDRLGELFEGLRERGRYADALIVLVADHGEEFQEHGMFLHTQLYEETVRIPLAMRLPPGAGERDVSVPDLVALADVFPTILDFLEIAPPAGFQGRSLLALARGERSGGDRTLFFTSRASGTLGLRDGRWKLIYEPRTRAAELYDLAADPGERHDVSETNADAKQQAETSRQLRALGYIQRGPAPSGPESD
jgi:arylsulfatase A-like enzyme